LALLSGIPRKPPTIGSHVGLGFWYETDAMAVLVTRVAVDSPTPPYSPAYEKALMNPAISLCLHLVGPPCGSEAEVQAALKWMETLPKHCPAEYLKTYDPEVCKLVLHWLSEKNYFIYFRDKRKVDPQKAPGPIKALGRFSDLGTLSFFQQRGKPSVSSQNFEAHAAFRHDRRSI